MQHQDTETGSTSGTDYLTGLREDHARFSRVLSMIGRDARRLVDDPTAVVPLFAEAVASFDSQDGEFIRMVEDLEGA